jgi:DNA repair exonuclease SbcCD ATPase subunit
MSEQPQRSEQVYPDSCYEAEKGVRLPASNIYPQRVPEESSDNMSPQAHPKKSEQPQEWRKDGNWGIDVGHKKCPQCYDTGSRDLLFDAHNAALAAANQAVVDAMSLSNEMCEKLEQQLAAANRKYKPQVLQDSEARVEELERQLAAERKTKEKAIEAWGNRNLKLAEQLAAEQEKLEALNKEAFSVLEENKRLVRQLAAEREKIKLLVAALEKLQKRVLTREQRQIVDDALAKAKEAK